MPKEACKYTIFLFDVQDIMSQATSMWTSSSMRSKEKDIVQTIDKLVWGQHSLEQAGKSHGHRRDMGSL